LTDTTTRTYRHSHEELVNALTHGIGAVASIAGGAVLITLAVLYSDVWHIVGAAVYVAALVTLYSASTLYHAVPYWAGAKTKLKIFDHCAIYLLIAGTYTPFTLGSLREGWGWVLFATIWSLAALGILFKLFYTGRFQIISTLVYIAMGWLIIIAAGPVIEALPPVVFGWLLAGGILYTAGTLFFGLDKKVPYFHGVWHLFVIGGSVCHFIAVFNQILAFQA
jgi:hemolysin III